RAQLGKIVNLAVENNPNAFVFVENGLMPAGKINDAETAHAQAHAVFDENAFVIRTAMHDRLAHAMDDIRVQGTVGAALHHAGYAAHGLSFSPRTDIAILKIE